jgi:prepilin signal peptidase PulO-like enzyme (type II secretory pathway)
MTVASVVAVLATVIAAELVMRQVWLPRWQQRGFTGDVLTVKWVTVTRVLVVTGSGVSALWWYDIWSAGVGFACLAWLGVIAVTTDLVDRKIPREPCWVVWGVATLVAVLSPATSYAAWSAAVGLAITVVVVGVLLALSGGALGSGDARLLLALSSVAWWSGYTPILVGLLFAAVLQVFARFTIFRRLASRNADQKVGYPFGPALVVGYALAVIFVGQPGNVVNEWAGILL